MKVNLHIDSIVLDGLGIASSQTQLFQQSLTTHLTSMLTQQGTESLFTSTTRRNDAIQLEQAVDPTSLGSQLGNVIHSNISQCHSSILPIAGDQSCQ